MKIGDHWWCPIQSYYDTYNGLWFELVCSYNWRQVRVPVWWMACWKSLLMQFMFLVLSLKPRHGHDVVWWLGIAASNLINISNLILSLLERNKWLPNSPYRSLFHSSCSSIASNDYQSTPNHAPHVYRPCLSYNPTSSWKFECAQLNTFPSPGGTPVGGSDYLPLFNPC